MEQRADHHVQVTSGEGHEEKVQNEKLQDGAYGKQSCCFDIADWKAVRDMDHTYLLKLSSGLTWLTHGLARAVCDPVMGDSSLEEDGHMYVKEGLLGVYRDRIIPLATVITPNQYEAQLLTSRSIKTQQDALAVCQDLQQRGPSTVVRV